ncbi:MAG: site-2 protease family protein [Kiloniellales bacterium]
MFFHRVTLFRLLGFTVRVDASWLLLAILIVWSLAGGYFPQLLAGYDTGTYIWMGVAGAIGLLFSIVFHELSHSLIARRFGMPIEGITLFLFGGVAEMHEEPSSAKGEFLMAVAGPLASLLLAALFYGFSALGGSAEAATPVTALLDWLAFVNLVLAIFNLVPAFPLDGGRMLRATLWGWKGDLEWATRIAARAGSAFGILLMVLAAVNLIYGNVIGALWYFLIGLFVRGAANMGYVQTVTKRTLGDDTVARFMHRQPIAVDPDLSVDRLIDDYVYRHYFRVFPVVTSERLIGLVTLDDVKKVGRDRWTETRVADIMEGASPDNCIRADAPALEALNRMREKSLSKLMVVDGSRLIGIVTLRDLLGFLSLKLDLEEGMGGDPIGPRAGSPSAR